MYAQRASLIAFFVLAVWTRATSAGELELKLGQVRASSLTPGQAQSFVVSLGAGDFARIGVNPRGQTLIVKTYDPTGKLWIATNQGLAMLDHLRLPKTDRKPAIYIENVTVGRNSQAPQARAAPPTRTS